MRSVDLRTGNPPTFTTHALSLHAPHAAAEVTHGILNEIRSAGVRPGSTVCCWILEPSSADLIEIKHGIESDALLQCSKGILALPPWLNFCERHLEMDPPENKDSYSQIPAVDVRFCLRVCTCECERASERAREREGETVS